MRLNQYIQIVEALTTYTSNDEPTEEEETDDPVPIEYDQDVSLDEWLFIDD
jgi:hypothetical protein